MKGQSPEVRFAICIRNAGYRASLVVRRIYKVVPDREATKHKLIRIVDESGEDYLYPQRMFAAIGLPKAVERIFSLAT